MDLIVNFPQHPVSRVSFATHMEVTYIKNLSQEHNMDLWFTDSEMKSFKSNTQLIVRAITSSGITVAQYDESHVNETSAFLGLENYICQQTYKEIKRRRRAIIDAVLSEQMHQECYGFTDVDAIADVSRTVSDMSYRRARLIAMLHAEEECK